MRLFWSVILLTTGCDKVLGLTERFDAAPERDADLRPDAVDCVLYPGGQPDEDADGRNDFCDNCPTVSNANQVDGDGDLVGFDCDPAPQNAGDRIAFFGSMLSSDGLELDPGVTLASGAATIATSRVKVKAPVKPTKVIAELSIRTFDSGNKLTVEVVNASGQEWSCNVGFGLGECNGDNCVYARVPGSQPQPIMFDEAAMTTRVVLETRGNGFTQCTGTTTTGLYANSPASTTPASLEAQGTLAVKMTGTLELRNLIVYDRP